jgi:hypothetical protein
VYANNCRLYGRARLTISLINDREVEGEETRATSGRPQTFNSRNARTCREVSDHSDLLPLTIKPYFSTFLFWGAPRLV